MGIFSKKKKTLSTQETFENLVKVKRGINLLKKKLEDPMISSEERKEHEDKLASYWKIFENVQEGMVDISKGLYLGMGYDLKSDEKVVKPKYMTWRSGHSHVGVQGTTRTGKSVLLMAMVRQIIRTGENVIIVDPKGGFGQEILSLVIEELARSKRLQDFVYVSPSFIELSDRTNVIFGLANEEISSMIAKLTESGGTSEVKVFSDIVYKTVMAITNSFEVIESFNDPSGSLAAQMIEYEIYKWNSFVRDRNFKNFDIESDAIDKANADESHNIPDKPSKQDYYYNRTLITFKDIGAYARYDQLELLREVISGLIIKDEQSIAESKKKELFSKKEQALTLLEDILSQDKVFFTKISVSLSTILTQLSIGNMGHIFCDIKINPLFIRLHSKTKKVVAVIQPFPLKYKKVSEMSVKIFMGMLESLMGVVGSSGRPLNERIHLLIDEAASVVYPGIQVLFSQAGGLGVSLYVFTQSFADWKLTLGEHNAKVIMDNINTNVRMRMNDIESCRVVAEEVGYKKTFNTTTMHGNNDTRFMSDVKEELIVPPEFVRKIPVARAIVKNDKDIYMLDLPYYSGPKGLVSMPELSIERLLREMTLADEQYTKALDQINVVESEIKKNMQLEEKVVDSD